MVVSRRANFARSLLMNNLVAGALRPDKTRRPSVSDRLPARLNLAPAFCRNLVAPLRVVPVAASFCIAPLGGCGYLLSVAAPREQILKTVGSTRSAGKA
jgi:hypothetical protein